MHAIQEMQGLSVIGNDTMLHHQICHMPGIIPLLPFVPVGHQEGIEDKKETVLFLNNPQPICPTEHRKNLVPFIH
jgi:hypothetical protein